MPLDDTNRLRFRLRFRPADQFADRGHRLRRHVEAVQPSEQGRFQVQQRSVTAQGLGIIRQQTLEFGKLGVADVPVDQFQGKFFDTMHESPWRASPRSIHSRNWTRTRDNRLRKAPAVVFILAAIVRKSNPS